MRRRIVLMLAGALVLLAAARWGPAGIVSPQVEEGPWTPIRIPNR